MKYEPAAPVGDKPAKELKPGEQALVFPHLYGGINIDAITAELSIQRADNGKFVAIEGLWHSLQEQIAASFNRLGLCDYLHLSP